jgi:hypothetical protein
MAGINSLKRLRNVNLTSIKEGVKKSAALTLLLSTTACNINGIFGDEILNFFGGLLCCMGLLVPASLVVGLIGSQLDQKIHPEKYTSQRDPIEEHNPPYYQ